MELAQAENIITAAWEQPNDLANEDTVRMAVATALAALDDGSARVATPTQEGWQVHAWLKKAVLLSFRLNQNQTIAGGPGAHSCWWDKVPSKFEGWQSEEFRQAGFRAVPNCTVRHGAYIAPSAVLMPSFINIGAYVGEATMIDTWSTVGSCAQIGAHCHISGGVGIGGVLEPLQANPVIVEDNCFIGARSEIAEGVVVREGAVISMGVYLGASTKIVDRKTGHIQYGEVPPYAVIVPGNLPAPNGGPSLYCAVIVKQVDAKTRSKTGINDLLRFAD